ncbi:uncharacterized protein [Diadema antillarum]|uniref:uncharacterized protein n=1 Tax=Diadema antillarum TaxID=105358 RepID=UPI003A859A74
MAESTVLDDQITNAKQGLIPDIGPLDNSHVTGGDAMETPRSMDINAEMEVNANGEINANPEANANVTVDSNANTPQRTDDSDRDLIEQDSLESLDPGQEPEQVSDQELAQDLPQDPGQDGSAPVEVRPVVSEEPPVGAAEGEEHQDTVEQEQASPGFVGKQEGGESGNAEGGDMKQEDNVDAEAEEEPAPDAIQEETMDELEGETEGGEHDTREEGESGTDIEGHLEGLLSPAFSESKTFDIITTDREFETESEVTDDSGSKGTADATHDDLNTTATSDDRPTRQRKEPVIDASKLREREERSVSNRRAHLQKKADSLKDRNEQRRAAVEERRRQQEMVEQQKKEAILRRSRDREDTAHGSREKRRSWSAFGSRESPSPTPSASTPRGRSSDRLTRKSPTSNLTGSKQLSSSVSNIYHRSVKLVRLGPNEDDWFQMHVPETRKKKPGSPGATTPEPGFADARSPVGALRSPVHHRSTPNLASSYKRSRPKAFQPRDIKSTHSTPTHGPRASAMAVTERLSRPKGGMKSPSTSTTNLSTPTSSAKRAPSPRTVGRPPSPRQRTPLSARSSNASNASGESLASGGSTTPRRPSSPRNLPRDKSSDSHSSGKTQSNKSTSSNPPPIKKALTPSAGVTKPTPSKASQSPRPKPSTPAKKESPTSATPDKPRTPAAEKPKVAAADKAKAPPATKAPSTPTSGPSEKSKPKETKQNGSENGDGKPDLTDAERAKQALAERRRQAREKAEREAELERQRQEQLKREEEERKKKAEEERIRQEEEAMRLAEENRIAEEERLRREAEEEEKRMEGGEVEERGGGETGGCDPTAGGWLGHHGILYGMKAEEERKKQEEIAKRQEELAKQEAELAAKHKKEEEERDARRRRVDEIMKRARRGAQNKDENSQPGSPDSEKSSDGAADHKTNGISSSSMLLNDKYRHLLSGNRGIGSNPVSGDDDSAEEGDQGQGEASDAAAAATVSEAQNGVEESGPPAAELEVGGGGDTNTASLTNSEDANQGDGNIMGGGDADREAAKEEEEKEEEEKEKMKEDENEKEVEEDGTSVDALASHEGEESSTDVQESSADVQESSADVQESSSDVQESSADVQDGTAVDMVTSDADGEQIAEEPGSKEKAVEEKPVDNGPLEAPSIPEILDADEKTDLLENANNGQMDQDSNLVIDPKGTMGAPLLIEAPAAKTEIEITNGEGGQHEEDGPELEASLKVGVKLAQSPEDSGIEGNGQSGAVLTSEI